MLTCSQHLDSAATAACTRCERPLCDACTERLDGRPYCATCVEELQRKLEERARMGQVPGTLIEAPEGVGSALPIEPQAPVAWGRAALFGTLAGLVGAGIWYGTVMVSDYKLGLVAIGVGWVVGAGCAKGSGGRASAGLGALSVVIALGAMFLGEYLIVNHYVLAAFAKQNPGVQAPAYIPLGLFFEIYGEGFGGMDAVFYAIGAYEAFKIPAGLRKR
jgi:hypothetical protein